MGSNGQTPLPPEPKAASATSSASAPGYNRFVYELRPLQPLRPLRPLRPVEIEANRKLLQANDELHDGLNAYKDEITQHSSARRWEKCKKITNDYELVSSSSHDFPGIAHHCPISRSFFKLWEMMVDFEACIITRPKKPMRVAFLAEGPGGFVEAFALFRRRFYADLYHRDALHGMTLRSDDKQVPFWNSTECERYRMRVHRGADGTGNLYDARNVEHLILAVGRAACDLVTADGGFDFSGNFNTQEECSARLVACETSAALQLLRPGGAFILKLYDVRTPTTLRLVLLLRVLFDRVAFVKPLTSRPANSEKYAVCLGFKGLAAPALSSSAATGASLTSLIREDAGRERPSFAFVHRLWLDAELASNASNSADVSDSSHTVAELFPTDFLADMLTFNSNYIGRQVAYIRKTLALIASLDEPVTNAAASAASTASVASSSCAHPPTASLLRASNGSTLRRQVAKCVRWCENYRMPMSSRALRRYSLLSP